MMCSLRWTAAPIALGLCAACVALPAGAQGGPPMLTDDPGTPGDGHWEVNFAMTTRHGAFGTEGEWPLLDINYGIGERIQLKYEIPWINLNAQHEASRSGLGSSLIGVKYRFYDAGETSWQVSTYPQVEFRNPGSSSARRGLVDDGTALLLPFEIQRAFHSFSVNFEIGRELRSRGSDEWSAGAVIGRAWTKNVEGMAELRGASSQTLDQSQLSIGLGTRAHVSEHGTALLSVGKDLHNELDARASVLAYLGWQAAW